MDLLSKALEFGGVSQELHHEYMRRFPAGHTPFLTEI